MARRKAEKRGTNEDVQAQVAMGKVPEAKLEAVQDSNKRARKGGDRQFIRYFRVGKRTVMVNDRTGESKVVKEDADGAGA